MRTAELTGALLDYWVARAEGLQGKIEIRQEAVKPWVNNDGLFVSIDYHTVYSPSTDWAQGGPIIERERIQLEFHEWHKAAPWCALQHGNSPANDERGPTPLVSAMRAYVASKFGDEVQDQRIES